MKGASQGIYRSCLCILFLIVWIRVGCVVSGADDTPASSWATAYAWVRTGENLAEAELWPLALGSYIEADRLLTKLAAAHPEFEAEMIAFRRNALQESIATTQKRLTTDEHEMMMKYLDFIETLELGESQRYADQYSAARDTLEMARVILEEIAANKPDSFRKALATQYARLESSLTWVDSQILYRETTARRRWEGGSGVDDSSDRGTTQFVTLADLPTEAGLPGPSALFPGVPLVSEAESSEKDQKMASESSAAPGRTATGVMRFRITPKAKVPSEPIQSDRKME